MCLDEGMYEPALLKSDILYYCQGLKAPKENKKRVTLVTFHSELSGDEDSKDHALQPGDFIRKDIR